MESGDSDSADTSTEEYKQKSRDEGNDGQPYRVQAPGQGYPDGGAHLAGEEDAMPEEKALIDLVHLGQVGRVYAQTGAQWVQDQWADSRLAGHVQQGAQWVWSRTQDVVPVGRAHARACWDAAYRQMYQQYAFLNLRTRSYRYRTFVTFSLIVLLFFVFLDTTFFATRIDPPSSLRFRNPELVIHRPIQWHRGVPEVRLDPPQRQQPKHRPLTQEEDAKQHSNLRQRTPGLGSEKTQILEIESKLNVDPNKPSTVAKLLSRMVAKDVNMVKFFRAVLDKYDPSKEPVMHSVVDQTQGTVREDIQQALPEGEVEETIDKKPIKEQPGISLDILTRIWDRTSLQNDQPRVSEGGVDFENPYLLGDLGAAMQSLPPIRNMSRHIHQLAEHTEHLNADRVAADDPRLLSLVNTYWLRKPSKLPYHLKEPNKVDFSMGQAAVVNQILGNRKKGFFVECGALDGETRSNTLYFERELGWTGILIEPGPVNYRRMVKKNRKAYLSPACLGVEPYPSRKYFHRGRNRGRLLDAEDSFQWVHDQYMILDRTGVQCLPLYSLLKALNRTHIDYFSLDVEGVELEVLKSIPFHLLDIDVITVEFAHGRASKEQIRDYVTSVLGYRVVFEVSRKDWLANDFVLVKESKIRKSS